MYVAYRLHFFAEHDGRKSRGRMSISVCIFHLHKGFFCLDTKIQKLSWKYTRLSLKYDTVTGEMRRVSIDCKVCFSVKCKVLTQASNLTKSRSVQKFVRRVENCMVWLCNLTKRVEDVPQARWNKKSWVQKLRLHSLCITQGGGQRIFWGGSEIFWKGIRGVYQNVWQAKRGAGGGVPDFFPPLINKGSTI